MSCSFCANFKLRRLFGANVRAKSVKRIMQEIASVRKKIPYIDGIVFGDDLFLGMKRESIIEFSRQYKEKVGLPFFCLISPYFFDEEIIERLFDAGCRTIEIGLQSGSQKTLKFYRRPPLPQEKFRRLLQAIERHSDSLIARYDLLLDNPEEELSEKMKTLDLVLQLPYPHYLGLFSLTPYPGTLLYEKWIKGEKMKKNLYLKYYFSKESGYITLLLLLLRENLPKMAIRALTLSFIVKSLEKKGIKRLYSPPFFLFLRLSRLLQDISFFKEKGRRAKDMLEEIGMKVDTGWFSISSPPSLLISLFRNFVGL
jgi:radical SAM superfamily enzyme YgiQ (UPF0313 family)